MNRPAVDKIVEAVLYEGYLLYPYRPSSRKNQQRFTFGRVYPEAYSHAQRGAEPCVMQTQCLAETEALEVTVRFLHPMAREIGRLLAPIPALPETNPPPFQVVPALLVNGQLYQTWQEAVEQEVHVPLHDVSALLGQPVRHPFSFPSSESLEPLCDRDGQVVGVLHRRQHALEGMITLSAEAVDARVTRLTVRVENQTPVPTEDLDVQNEVILRTLASTHTILHAPGGVFLSLMDPPADYAEAAAACKNTGTWPVLVGEPEKHERDTMLSSPIILYDYPQIAPESPGDFFDGTEIDEMLTLRILTMTDEEKREMRHADAHARRLLQRTESLPNDHLMQMHGTMRDLRPFEEAFGEDFFNTNAHLDAIAIDGVRYRRGGRVRIRPRRDADIMDLALEGKTAVIEAIEQNVEDEIYLALVLDDDPGKDLGMMRQPGHRFFFTPHEVELLEAPP